MGTRRRTVSERVRTPAAIAYAFLSLLVYGPLALLALPFDRDQRVHDRLSIWWARGALRLGGLRFRVVGGEDLRRDTHYIVAANHQSMIDPLLIVAALQSRTSIRFVAKADNFKLPIVGWTMRLFGHLSVDPSSARRSLAGLKQAEADPWPEPASALTRNVLPQPGGP